LDAEYTAAEKLAKKHGLPWEEGHFDFMLGERGALQVLFAWRGELRVWRGRLREADPGPSPRIDWERTIEPQSKEEEVVDRLRTQTPTPFGAWAPILSRPVLRLPCALHEPFQAYQDADHFCFVTASGELHALAKHAERPRLRQVWADPRRPIATVLTDTASGKTFAFTDAPRRPMPETPAVYFEVSGKASPAPYNFGGLPPESEEDPLARLMGYARVLLQDHKVALKD
jgi:hypothetical protein